MAFLDETGLSYLWTKIKGVLTDGSVTKVGTGTVGSGTKPIYLNAGTPTASTSTAGGVAKPVYLNKGEITACSSTVGGTTQPVYMSSGTITAMSGALALTYGGTGKTTAPLGLYALVNGSTALTSTGLATGDYVPIGDVSAATGKKVTLANLSAYLKSALGVDTLQTDVETLQAAVDDLPGGATIVTGTYTGSSTSSSGDASAKGDITLGFSPKVFFLYGFTTSTYARWEYESLLITPDFSVYRLALTNYSGGTVYNGATSNSYCTDTGVYLGAEKITASGSSYINCNFNYGARTVASYGVGATTYRYIAFA